MSHHFHSHSNTQNTIYPILFSCSLPMCSVLKLATTLYTCLMIQSDVKLH